MKWRNSQLVPPNSKETKKIRGRVEIKADLDREIALNRRAKAENESHGYEI